MDALTHSVTEMLGLARSGLVAGLTVSAAAVIGLLVYRARMLAKWDSDRNC